MEIRRCMNCMSELQQTDEICPVCGFDNKNMEQPEFAMPYGYILHGKYLIGRVLGQGGFGITYIGLDLVLDIKVAIKEYYPMGMVTRDSKTSSSLLWNSSQMSQSQRQGAYDSFLKEARKMAKVDEIPSIVRVRDMLLENETAYIVMDYVEGVTLKDKLIQDGPMPFSQCISLLSPMMEGLARVHKQGIIHRDISPDNIMIQKNGKVRLLDLGAAKDMTVSNAMNSQLVAKKGFSPLEQYAENGKIGPWTDVYALCATIYYAVIGKLLPAALDRVMGDDKLVFDSALAESLPDAAVRALKDGLALKTEERIQSVEELLQRLDKAVQSQESATGQGTVRKTCPKPEPDLEATQPLRPEPDLEAAQPLKPEPDLEATQPLMAKEETEQQSRGQSFWLQHKKKICAVVGVCVLFLAVFIIMRPGVETKDTSVKENADSSGTLGGKHSENQELSVMMADELLEESEGDAMVLGSDWQRSQISAINFLDSMKGMPKEAWDVSAKQDGSVMAWVESGEKHTLYIAGEGGVMAPESCNGLFARYENLEEIKFNGCFNTSQVTNMEWMFYKCNSLRQLDVSGFDTSQVTNMDHMFSGCRSLRQLDVSGFDTSQVTDMSRMFCYCESLKQLDVSGFDTSQVTDMNWMFKECSSLEQLDVSGFDTSHVIDMQGMFDVCKSLRQLDVSGFDTSQVTDMSHMFGFCSSLEQLDVSGFDTSQVTSTLAIFSGCNAQVIGWDNKSK